MNHRFILNVFPLQKYFHRQSSKDPTTFDIAYINIEEDNCSDGVVFLSGNNWRMFDLIKFDYFSVLVTCQYFGRSFKCEEEHVLSFHPRIPFLTSFTSNENISAYFQCLGDLGQRQASFYVLFSYCKIFAAFNKFHQNFDGADVSLDCINFEMFIFLEINKLKMFLFFEGHR